MSQRPGAGGSAGAPIDEAAAYDFLQSQQFNQQYIQQMLMQKQYNQNNSMHQPMQQSFVDNDSQYINQQNSMISGRFGQPSQNQQQPESYRNMAGFNQQMPVQQQQKPVYSQNMFSQFHTVGGGSNAMIGTPTSDIMSHGPGIPASQGAFGQTINPLDTSMKLSQFQQFQGGNPMVGQQPNILSELMKNQFMPAQIPQIPAQATPPVFGQGFMNAAQILASIQQMPQAATVQTPASNFGDAKSSHQQQPNNMMALQQLLNSNLNQYQSLIDQMEKQSLSQQVPTTTISQGHQYALPQNSSRPQAHSNPAMTVASPLQGYSTVQQQQNSYLNDQRQPLKPSTQNYIDSAASSLDAYSYLLSGNNNNSTSNNNRVLSPPSETLEQENFGYDSSVKNTVSGPKSTYNPNAYQESYQQRHSQKEEDYLQRSPQQEKKYNQQARNEASPKVAWLSKQTGGEFYGYQNQQQKNSEGANSPLRQSANRLYQNDMDIYRGGNPASSQSNLLESSFNRNNPQTTAAFMNFENQNAPYMNASQNSSTILQEHHMNSQTNNNQRIQQQQQQQQYSPSDSYRYESENHQQMMNDNSMNLGKSQRIFPNAGGPNMMNQSQSVVNIDDMPVGGRPKTFEELLEENLKKMGQDPLVNEVVYTPQEPQKKEFLKRKSLKTAVASQPPKKYNYYVENFDEKKKKERSISQAPVERSTSQVPERSTNNPLKSHEEIQVYQKPLPSAPAAHFEMTPNRRAISPLENPTERNSDSNANNDRKITQKKRFLTRGSGTAGGKQGHQNPALEKKQKQQKQKKSNHPLLSDDEYPNDFNFAAEQDNKSPKLNHPPPPGINNQNQSYLSRQALAANKHNLDSDLNRNSIAEFEKLEQECSNNIISSQKQQQRPRSPVGVQQQYQAKEAQKQAVVNKRRKKLFDDSDSNDEDDDDGQIEEVSAPREEEVKAASTVQRNLQRPPSQNISENEAEGAPKSNVVKKFFYKEESAKQQQQQKSMIPQPSRITTSNDLIMSEQLERAMKQKMEQLDKAIETYNQQNEMAQKMKRENDSLQSKLRVDFRDFESKKKKELEDLERLKAEELDKLKKERKSFEQRQRNLQLVNTSSKKEREEIDFLKKELSRVQEEAKAKEGKMRAQIERLQKQVEELKGVNKEMGEELKHMGEQIRGQQQQQKQAVSNSREQLAQQNRYSFNNKEQPQQQQPKGILKNKEEQGRPVSATQFYNPMVGGGGADMEEEDDDEQDQDYRDDQHESQDEEDEEEEDAQQVPRKDERNLNQSHNNQQNMSQISSNVQPSSQTHHQHAPPNNEEDSEEFDMKFPLQYHNKNPSNLKVIEQIIGNDGKIQRVYENGKKEVIFNNGVKREVFPDGYTIVYFNNNDIKQTYTDQKVVYYFAEAKTTQTTFSDGLQVFKFANNQIEKHFPDGTKEIIFPDGTIKCIFADGEEESIFPDGTIQRIEKNGVKAIEFANGQKDILFPDGTRIKEYPDGRVRKTYPDGTCENSYRQT